MWKGSSNWVRYLVKEFRKSRVRERARIKWKTGGIGCYRSVSKEKGRSETGEGGGTSGSLQVG